MTIKFRLLATACALPLGLTLPSAASADSQQTAHGVQYEASSSQPLIQLAQVSAEDLADAADLDPDRIRRRLAAARDALAAAEASGEGVEKARRRVERLEGRLAEAESGGSAGAEAEAAAEAESAPEKEEQQQAAEPEAEPEQQEQAAEAEPEPESEQRERAADTEAQPEAEQEATAEAETEVEAEASDGEVAAEGNADGEARSGRSAQNADGDRDGERRRRGDRQDGDGERRDGRGDRDTAEASDEGAPPPAPEEGEVVAESGDRQIVRTDDNQVIIRHDESRRMRQGRGRVNEDRRRDGTTVTTVERPNGAEIVTVTARDGTILRRVRKRPNGTEIVLIDNRRDGDRDGRRGDRDGRRGGDRDRDGRRGRRDRNFELELGPLRVTIPRERYVVESRRASRRDIREALVAPPVEQVERDYSLEEIRYSKRLRDKVRRIDVDTVTFEFGSANIPDDQIRAMNELGLALEEVITENPDQVFLIEGHTDAVGSDLANLELSDRRAESVAIVLSEYFEVPPENLITQGYGEEFLKVETEAAERANRRVAVRPISQLMSGGQRPTGG